MYPVLHKRPTWIEVDIVQLEKNLAFIKEQAGNKEVWAVVKSDAYNHGIEGVFSTFVSSGICQFCVAQYEEAQQLQAIANQQDVAIDILIFGYIPAEKYQTLPANWRITVANFDMIESLAQEITRDTPIKIHIKIDSGMNRKGFKDREQFVRAFELLEINKHIEIEGLYTHFATSDCDLKFMRQQINRFKEITEGYYEQVRYVHAQNSYGLLQSEMELFNLVRPGGICYGMTGIEHAICKPIFNLYSTVTDIRKVTAGETIGYGNIYTFDNDGYVATLPIGYADGWRKKNTLLPVYKNNQQCQIVGKICMEQCMVFSEANILQENDIIELVGKNNSIFFLAAYNEICDYEFICSFLQRVPRIYKK